MAASELPRRAGILRRFMSTPRGYGGNAGAGVLAHPQHAAEVPPALAGLCRRGASVHVVLNPIPAFLDGRPSVQADGFDTFTHLLPLAAGFERLWTERFDKKARNQYRKAEKEGVTVAPTSDSGSLEAFYQLYIASNERWGSSNPSVSRDFYTALFRIAPEHALVWLARDRAGEPIAGAVCLYYADAVHLWSSAFLKERSALRPNDLLYGEMIRYAADRGYQVFDFGSSEGLPQVRAFKEQFGPDLVPVRHVVHAHPLAQRLASLLKKRR